jgi:hypothetical protein
MKPLKILSPELLSRLNVQRLENLFKVVEKRMYIEGWQSWYWEDWKYRDKDMNCHLDYFKEYIDYRREILKALRAKSKE